MGQIMRRNTQQSCRLLSIIGLLAGPALAIASDSWGNNDLNHLTEHVTIGLSVKALDGDGRAALMLSASAKSKKEELYWAQISAENGFPPGLYTFGRILSENNNRQSLIRVRFWLGLAKSHGIKLADFALCQIAHKLNHSPTSCKIDPQLIEIH
jgi:hypothetical protein